MLRVWCSWLHLFLPKSLSSSCSEIDSSCPGLANSSRFPSALSASLSQPRVVGRPSVLDKRRGQRRERISRCSAGRQFLDRTRSHKSLPHRHSRSDTLRSCIYLSI
ncbi:hypothetical protein B0H16DRAFT_731238 [Mycena metata]|uniref:Secreted protein n=1 Tax=Mycena metata TaxID=1033252 RepID=A0AAD7ND23_9AGAR|nr:hypothetical protein B0H16DRAFT_731238 [Mycena metata]